MPALRLSDAAVNPRTPPSSRYDPVADVDNALAHDDPELFEATSPKGGPDTDDVQATVRAALTRAVQHYQETLEPDQKTATDYYHARPFGDEQDGRSKVVSSDVRDSVLAQMPSLMRVFFGPERAVEYSPRGPEDEALAGQMTDYANVVIAENGGFLVFHSAFKDALTRRLGIFKWWWATDSRVEAAEYSGLDSEQVQSLVTDDDTSDVEVLGIRRGEDGTETYDVRVTRRQEGGCVKIAAVPNEEFVFTPDARDLDSAPLVAHVREVPREDLIRLGIDEDLIDRAARSERSRVGDSGLEDARQYHGGVGDIDDDDSLDASQRRVLFAEAYALVDADGDGIAELRLFQCVGGEYEIANGDGLGEIVDEAPFAVLTPDPEPHTIIGLSNFDLLKDVQRVKSQVLRGTLNSLALALEPKTAVVPGEVNVGDLTNPQINGIIRVTKQPDLVMKEYRHEFVGADTLAVLQYYDEIKENRTGQSKASQGLDADSLQSATKAAVAATLSAAQQRVELIARIFAETGVKRLMGGILRLLVRYQDRERLVRLRNRWVSVDPRQWDASLDVQVNVALGQGTDEDKVQTLSALYTVQKELMAAGSPLVTHVELRNTLRRLCELTGHRNSDEFFRPWGPEEEEQARMAAANQPPPPDPNAGLVQVESEKAAVRGEIELLKARAAHELQVMRLELDRWKAEAADMRERERLARDMALRELEIELKHRREIVDSELRARVEADKAMMQPVQPIPAMPAVAMEQPMEVGA